MRSESLRNLQMSGSNYKSGWFHVLQIVLKYAALSIAAIFLFRILALYVAIHPEHTYIVLTVVIIISGIAGSLIYRKSVLLENNNVPLPDKALSRREKEVFELLIANYSNKQICEHLFIENSTLKSHINRIYRKLAIKNRKELQYKYRN